MLIDVKQKSAFCQVPVVTGGWGQAAKFTAKIQPTSTEQEEFTPTPDPQDTPYALADTPTPSAGIAEARVDEEVKTTTKVYTNTNYEQQAKPKAGKSRICKLDATAQGCRRRKCNFEHPKRDDQAKKVIYAGK